MEFTLTDLQGLWRPAQLTTDMHQITIIGGSELFQGAPLMSLVAASRLVDNVFLATPEEDKHIVNKEQLFSIVRSVIWVPREEIAAYIEKSSSILIGPGLMRYRTEGTDPGSDHSKQVGFGKYTYQLTQDLLRRFSAKRWVVDGGSLQVMEADWIPPSAIVTPNLLEFEALFGEPFHPDAVVSQARAHQCVIVGKNHTQVTVVSDGVTTYEIGGGNEGLSRGGVGDVLAGVITGLAATNEPLLAAAAGVFLIKRTAERLFDQMGYGYNADDLAREVFVTKKALLGY